jgi:predicted Rossmann-fold nucleotide-binding protein
MGLFDWMKKNAVKEGYIKKSDLESIYLVDTPEEIVEIIEKNTKKNKKIIK